MKNKVLFSTIFFFFLAILFVDIGNIDGMRQGTEGFYLKVFKEMIARDSIQIPYYNGNPHWSKPPFHFWTAILTHKLFPFTSFITSGRVSVFIISFLLLFLIAHYLKLIFGTKKIITLSVFMASVFFIKYSRIYMMEISLAFLTFLSNLIYLRYINTKSKKDLFGASVALAFACLVKGPVALAMAIPPILLTSVNRHNLLKIKTYMGPALLILFSLSLSSIWYILCFLDFGQEFINYFFLRENLGKFSSKSYPIKNLFEGFLLYGLPWTLLIGSIWKTKKQLTKNSNTLYLIVCSIFYFLIWLIPSQRSHHYALPSLTAFLAIVSIYLHQNQDKRSPLFGGLVYFIIFIGLIINALLFYFSLANGLTYAAIIILILAMVWSLKSKQSALKLSASFFLSFCSIWNFSLTAVYLPVIPYHVAQQVTSRPLAVIFRKPLYMEETLQKTVIVLNKYTVNNELSKNRHIKQIILNKNELNFLGHNYEIIKTWPLWKRGINARDIFMAIRQQNLHILQDNYVLIRLLQ